MNYNHAVYCDRASASARMLARALGWERVRNMPSLVRRARTSIINWGSMLSSSVPSGLLHNPPGPVQLAISKRASYSIWQGRPWALPIVTDPQPGRAYLLRRDGLSGGRGISLWLPGGPIQSLDFSIANISERDFVVPLFRKTHEFRVHVAFGRVLGISQKKAPRLSAVNRVIRSHANGWIFSYNNLALMEEDKDMLGQAAVQAVNLLGLDFGAADILVKLNQETPRRVRSFKICEVNTAPGLEQTTLRLYKEAFESKTRELFGI